MTNLNNLNAKLSALAGTNITDLMASLVEFNKANISKPYNEGPYEYNVGNEAIRELIDGMDEYHSYTLNSEDVYPGQDITLEPGDVFCILGIDKGSSVTETHVIHDGGWSYTYHSDMAGYIAEEGYRDGLWLYQGVRDDFAEYVDIPMSNTFHEAFDYLVKHWND